jgi:NADH:ubiquinone oxidoreductase subunit 4 (subunit M)
MEYIIKLFLALDGLSLLFIILSTFNSSLCLSSASINIENVYFMFVIFNRISISECIFSDRDILLFLYIF